MVRNISKAVSSVKISSGFKNIITFFAFLRIINIKTVINAGNILYFGALRLYIRETNVYRLIKVAQPTYLIIKFYGKPTGTNT